MCTRLRPNSNVRGKCKESVIRGIITCQVLYSDILTLEIEINMCKSRFVVSLNTDYSM